jgi:hypothetical protein
MKPNINLCDKNLNIISNSDYEVTKIYLSSENGHKDIELEILGNSINSKFRGVTNSILISEISRTTQLLLQKLGSSATKFTFDALDLLWERLHNPQIKANSGNKVDIYLEIFIKSQNIKIVEGFSIKSNLGSPTSLLNASALTNFLYSTTSTSGITSSTKPKKLVSMAIKGVITQFGPCDATYRINLKKIHQNFDNLISALLLEYYGSRGGKIAKVLASFLVKNPTITFQNTYSELLSFLKATAFGMVPSIPWNGSYTVSGGMIVVKTSGELVFFYLKNSISVAELDGYLYDNCKFDTPSRGRHGFGSIINGNQFKLNLLIRL